jgi:hypothetical protein
MKRRPQAILPRFQIFNEVCLDTPLDEGSFLEKAVVFANDKLGGSLVAEILIETEAKKNIKFSLTKLSLILNMEVSQLILCLYLFG